LTDQETFALKAFLRQAERIGLRGPQHNDEHPRRPIGGSSS
jgi:hypothetical protein